MYIYMCIYVNPLFLLKNNKKATKKNLIFLVKLLFLGLFVPRYTIITEIRLFCVLGLKWVIS